MCNCLILKPHIQIFVYNQDMNELIVGLPPENRDKVTIHLKRLLPNLKEGEFIFVGGLAIRHHLIHRGINYPDRGFNDIDIVTKSEDVVTPNVVKDFLVYHHHNQGHEWYFALVDPLSKTKVDIFDNNFYPERTVEASFEGEVVKIQSIEDQLIKTVFDIQRISESAKVDPKQFLDTRLLMQIADMKLAEKLWRKKAFEKYPDNLYDSIVWAEDTAQEHPEWVQVSPFKKPAPYKCMDCISTPELPLTPMEEIYKVLGMVE